MQRSQPRPIVGVSCRQTGTHALHDGRDTKQNRFSVTTYYSACNWLICPQHGT